MLFWYLLHMHKFVGQCDSIAQNMLITSYYTKSVEILLNMLNSIFLVYLHTHYLYQISYNKNLIQQNPDAARYFGTWQKSISIRHIQQSFSFINSPLKWIFLTHITNYLCFSTSQCPIFASPTRIKELNKYTNQDCIMAQTMQDGI